MTLQQLKYLVTVAECKKHYRGRRKTFYITAKPECGYTQS